MDPVASDRALLARLFAEWQKWPRAESHFEVLPLMDEAHDRCFATELLAAGVPKERIVLAFYPESVRHFGEFAVH
ncbi:MAG: element excision factor XisI family protein [Polyangiales bacterium]